MAVRRDAGLALAKFCVQSAIGFRAQQPAHGMDHRPHHLDPGAPSIIPGGAEMLFQIRDDDPKVIERLEGLLRNMAAEVSAKGPCGVAVERIRTGAPA
jgi:N-carbamoyl-L-amino-acid hydrolase